MGERRAAIILLLILCSLMVTLPNIGIVKAESTIYIRADGTVEGTDKIQREGNVYTLTDNIINQSIVVERFNIVIDGAGYTIQGTGVGRGIQIGNPYNTTIVTITNIAIQGFDTGICVYEDIGENKINGLVIVGNNLTNNYYGIRFSSSFSSYINNTIIGNYLIANHIGISMRMGHHGDVGSNQIVGNQIANNDIGMYFVWWGDFYSWKPNPFYMNNSIYNNNFISNNQNVVNGHIIYAPDCANFWDNGATGNYWSDYNGADNDGDAIGDTPYVIDENNTDNYPLMAPIKIFDAGTWEWIPFNVDVVSNSTVSGFSFNPESDLIRFNVEGEDGTTGFCRITIPKDLLHTEGNWIVLVDGNSVIPTVNEDATDTYLYFTYNLSTKTVEIIGTDAIPEFPSWTPTLLVLIVFAVAVVIYKRKLSRKLN